MQQICKIYPFSYVLPPPAAEAAGEPRLTVRSLMEKYVRDYGALRWEASTLKDNRQRIRDYVLPYIGDERIDALTTARLEAYYARLRASPAKRGAAGVSATTVALVHAVVRGALNQAVRWGYLAVNPAERVMLPKREGEARAVWSRAEYLAALDACDDHTLRLVLLLAGFCSMRIGEILGLEWRHVDLSGGVLHVRQELYRVDRRALSELHDAGRDAVYREFPSTRPDAATVLALKKPKTAASIRDIPFEATLADALRAERAAQAERKAGGAYQDYGLVLAQGNGRPFEERAILKKLDRLAASAGLPRVVIHSLRHTSVTMKLRASGGDIKSVQGDTGHAEARMVTDRYAHIMSEPRRALARVLERDLFGERADAASPEERLHALLRAHPELAEKLLVLAGLLLNEPARAIN